MIVLNYIRNESRRFQTYVANRVTEIRELTDPYQWRHCAAAINPADDASRGSEMSDFLRNDRWLKGPSFLHEREEEWPESKFGIVPSDILKLKKEVYTTSIEPAATLEDLVSRSSNWVHTLRRVAWLLKFLDWIKCRVERKKNPRHTADVRKGINQEDLEVVKRKIAILAQKINYPAEMKSLKERKPMRVASRLIKLKPIMKEDGVMPVGGRISLAPVTADAKNLMILPNDHHVTTILIRNIHEVNGHCGVEQVLSISREQFWIVKARATIKKILRRCVHCQWRMAPKMCQLMGQLTKVRLTPYKPPFT